MSFYDIKSCSLFILFISQLALGWSLESKTTVYSAASTEEDLTISNQNFSKAKGFDWDDWSFGIISGKSPDPNASDINSRELGGSYGLGFSYDQNLIIDGTGSSTRIPSQSLVNSSTDIGISYKINHEEPKPDEDSFTPHTTVSFRTGNSLFGQDVSSADLILRQRSITAGIKLSLIPDWSFEIKYNSYIYNRHVATFYNLIQSNSFLQKAFAGLSGSISGANLWDTDLIISYSGDDWDFDFEADQGLSALNMGETEMWKVGTDYNFSSLFSAGLTFTQNYSILSRDNSIALSLNWNFD